MSFNQVPVSGQLLWRLQNAKGLVPTLRVHWIMQTRVWATALVEVSRLGHSGLAYARLSIFTGKGSQEPEFEVE